jgi:hypothetical protein
LPVFLDLLFQLLFLLLSHACGVHVLEEGLSSRLRGFFDQGLSVVRADGLVQGRQLSSFHYFFQLCLSQTHDHILWLHVSVDDAAYAVKIVEAHEHLFANTPH